MALRVPRNAIWIIERSCHVAGGGPVPHPCPTHSIKINEIMSVVHGCGDDHVHPILAGRRGDQGHMAAEQDRLATISP
jgi:hypothetical protein